MNKASVLALIAIMAVGTSACFGQQIITMEEAKEAVRAFEGDPALEFTWWEYKSDECDPEWECALIFEWEVNPGHYDLRAGDPPDHFWFVDAASGEVTWAYHSDIGPDIAIDPPPGPLTQADCRQIAENYARAKYVDFDTMGFQLTDEFWDGTLWRFKWDQFLAYGASTDNSVEVEVDCVEGEIGSYRCSRHPTPPPQEPQITAEEAIEIVKTAKGLVTGGGESRLYASPGPTLWTILVVGEDAQGVTRKYAGWVDVVTGEIAMVVDMAGGAQTPTAIKPSIVGGAEISIRDLAAKVPGAKVYWLGKEAKLFVGKNRYTLVPGKDTIAWTWGTIKLSQKMKVVNGRLMVPSGLLDVLKSPPALEKAPPTPAKSK